jgi:hypothetical protein
VLLNPLGKVHGGIRLFRLEELEDDEDPCGDKQHPHDELFHFLISLLSVNGLIPYCFWGSCARVDSSIDSMSRNSYLSASGHTWKEGDIVKYIVRMVPVALLLLAMVVAVYQSRTRALQDEGSSAKDTSQIDTISFAENVLPIFQKRCLPCHALENYNPSELSLDSYDLLMDGGRHGDAVLPGKPDESPLVRKLLPDPPFGDQMPVEGRKKRGKRPGVKPLVEEEIELIATWIEQGARGN